MSELTNIQNTPSNIDNSGVSWVDMEFSHPERVIRLATSFSGIVQITTSEMNSGTLTYMILTQNRIVIK